LCPPIFFIVFNTLVTLRDWPNLVGIPHRKRNSGLIYFPISMLCLVLLWLLGFVPKHIARMGFFAMGYGHALAALAGKRFSRKTLTRVTVRKTYVGSLTMFAGLSAWDQLHWISSPAGITVILLAGFAAAALEAVTPWGMDNLSVPIERQSVSICCRNCSSPRILAKRPVLCQRPLSY
jgi:phytol kinase